MLEQIVTVVLLVLVIILGAFAKRYLSGLVEPVKKILEGSPKEQNVREMLEGLTTDQRTTARLAATAVEGVESLRDDVRQRDSRQSGALAAVEKKVSDDVTGLRGEVGELRGRVTTSEDNIRLLRASEQAHTDQIARLETALPMRRADRDASAAAQATREAALAAGAGGAERGAATEGSQPRPEPPRISRPDGSGDGH